jgi:antitoxin VapB
VSLNIKSAETHRLARELSDLTGESLTEAVTVALRERIARMHTTEDQKNARKEAILAIGRDVASRLSPEVRAIDHGELLYDEHGLPR